MLPLAAIALFALIVVTAPKPSTTGGKPGILLSGRSHLFKSVVYPVIPPTDDVQKIAPNGVMFDTRIRSKPTSSPYVPCKRTPCLSRIKTGMTEAERQLIETGSTREPPTIRKHGSRKSHSQ